MSRKRQDPDQIMKVFGIIGGFILLIGAVLRFFTPYGMNVIIGLLDLCFAVLILLSCFKPDEPIPFNEFLFLVLGIIVLIIGIVSLGFFEIVGGICLIIGGVVGLL